MLKKTLLSSFFLIFTSLCTPAFSWNANGHVLISQLAYEQLKPQIRKKVDSLSTALFKQLPFATQYELNEKYPNTSEFAKLSILPDHFRKQPLNIIFEQYQAKLPDAFQAIAENSTQHWHFIDKTYPSLDCPKPHDSQYDTVWAINMLKPIVQTEKNQLTKALALAMLTHFIEDIHQPLHTFSHAEKNCKIDKGGNLFCLSSYQEGKYCRHNLHHLWDTGVGFLKGRQSNLSRKMEKVRSELPSSAFKQVVEETDPSKWAAQSYQYAEFIYSIEPSSKPFREYYKEGQAIAKKQMRIASLRLAFTLNHLLEDKN